MKKSNRLFSMTVFFLVVMAGIAQAQESYFEVRIDSNVPGASVFVDNVRVGVTPLTVTAAKGVHALRLTADGFLDYLSSIELERNTALDVMLQPNPKAAPVAVSGETTYTIDTPPGYTVIQLFAAGRHYIALLQGDKGYILTGSALAPQGPYTGIDDPVFSSDGAMAGFVYYTGARMDGTEKYYVYTPSRTYGPFAGSPRDLCCSPAGDRFAFRFADSSGQYVQVGPTRQGPYDGTDWLTHLPGTGFAYKAKTARGWYWIEGSAQWGPYFSMESCKVLAGNQAAVFTAREKDPKYFWPTDDVGDAFVFSDHRMNGPFRKVPGLKLSGDRLNVAYACEDRQGWWIRSRTRTAGPFKNYADYRDDYAVSNDGSIAYLPDDGNGTTAVFLNGVKKEFAGEVFFGGFSEDGKGYCARLKADGKESLIVFAAGKTRTYGPYREVSDARLSADASAVLFVGTSDQGDGIYVNGKARLNPAGPEDGAKGKPPRVTFLYASPDFATLVYLVTDPATKRAVLHSGAEEVEWPATAESPRVAPDGSCIAFTLKRGFPDPDIPCVYHLNGTRKKAYVGTLFPGGSVFLEGKSVTVRVGK